MKLLLWDRNQNQLIYLIQSILFSIYYRQIHNRCLELKNLSLHIQTLNLTNENNLNRIIDIAPILNIPGSKIKNNFLFFNQFFLCFLFDKKVYYYYIY